MTGKRTFKKKLLNSSYNVLSILNPCLFLDISDLPYYIPVILFYSQSNCSVSHFIFLGGLSIYVSLDIFYLFFFPPLRTSGNKLLTIKRSRTTTTTTTTKHGERAVAPQQPTTTTERHKM